MNYKRIMATIMIKDGFVVQSIGFKKYLPVGSVKVAIEFLCSWGIDEIVLLDLDASKKKTTGDIRLLKESTTQCFVPLTYGGGIHTPEFANEVIACGADKVAVNYALIKNLTIVDKLVNMLGSQCVIGSVNYGFNSEKKSFEVYDHVDKKFIGINPVEFCQKLEQSGVGEILLHSVDRDGGLSGFDISTLKDVASVCSIPIIASGGAGKPEHFLDVFKSTNVAAAAAGNIWHYTEHSVTAFKAALIKEGATSVRMESGQIYLKHEFDNFGRPLRPSEEYLDELLFKKVHREII